MLNNMSESELERLKLRYWIAYTDALDEYRAVLSDSAKYKVKLLKSKLNEVANELNSRKEQPKPITSQAYWARWGKAYRKGQERLERG